MCNEGQICYKHVLQKYETFCINIISIFEWMKKMKNMFLSKCRFLKIIHYSKFGGENSSIKMLWNNSKNIFIPVFMYIIRVKMILDIVSQRCETYDFLKLVIHFGYRISPIFVFVMKNMFLAKCRFLEIVHYSKFGGENSSIKMLLNNSKCFHSGFYAYNSIKNDFGCCLTTLWYIYIFLSWWFILGGWPLGKNKIPMEIFQKNLEFPHVFFLFINMLRKYATFCDYSLNNYRIIDILKITHYSKLGGKNSSFTMLWYN